MVSFLELRFLSRNVKRLIMVGTDVVLLPFALWSAIAVRYGTLWPPLQHLWLLFLLTPLVTIPILYRLGLYRAVIRYMEDRIIYTVTLGVSLAVVILGALILMFRIGGVPRSSLIMFWLLATLYIVFSRLLARSYLSNLKVSRDATRIGIFGAGSSGAQLGLALRAAGTYTPVAFFDDRPDLQGSVVAGIRVYPPERVQEVILTLGISQILLAIPHASRSRHQEIIRELEPMRVKIRIMPAINDVVSGHIKVESLREVQIEDLLGRDAALPDPALLMTCILDKTVMVTGAGGSIGSELCRQIVALGPRRLILVDHSEYALYSIERELALRGEHTSSRVEILPLLGSVCDSSWIEAKMRRYGVETVYHAAAYKHVPLVEANSIEGVRNNVLGTFHTALAAMAAQVQTFVLVSTDKAVRPTNVMGASKRMAELVLQALATRGSPTRFCMVRFGNVLGSSGSVVPLFSEQIRRGGPITLTHPDITRYFMTIPEAAQLVLQAGAMGEGGEVFVLDMGEPVKIMDLARRMVHLSGLEIKDEDHPDGDIAIQVTGLRPGEKLYEELLIGEEVAKTGHPLIMKAFEEVIPEARMNRVIHELEQACMAFDADAVRAILSRCVSGYSPIGAQESVVSRAEPLSTRQHLH
ncbi:MAG TPA: nucleoside-diphosphate sugar epimerase/dehydratase [Burkholderiales bacterium]|nr:nucleoside-diphosphate sugar epimerase/dehydratase [Burkholderiales bacterium]